MDFRSCIDIHNGKVKQIVGSSLKDKGNEAMENFVSEKDADYYSLLYKENNLKGGHIILLNSKDSKFYEETKRQAYLALSAYKNGMQVGGGIDDENAMEFINAGASHVIVTSYVFKDGKINYDNLKKISSKVGRERLVLDVSCRKKEDGKYYVVSDRWQKFTEEEVNVELFKKLEKYCDEFLVHAVDVEGKNSGIDVELVKKMGDYEGIKITYAGGIKSIEDIYTLNEYGKSKLDFTIGSSLDIFGGKLGFKEVLSEMYKINKD